jgi:hypothetical protein
MQLECEGPKDKKPRDVVCRARPPAGAGSVPAGRLGLLLALALAVAGHGAAGECPPGSPDREPPVSARVARVSADAKTLPALELSWWSVDGGGGASGGGTYAVTGAIGQPDAGTSTSCWLAFDGGLWSGAAGGGSPIFCNGFETGDTSQWSSTTPADGAQPGGGTP